VLRGRLPAVLRRFPRRHGAIAVALGARQLRTSLAGAALDAAGRGWSVVPMHSASAGRCSCGDPSCPAPGKHTHGPWKERMRHAASIEQIRRWWRRWPDATIGVVTGAVSGLVVLAGEPRRGGGDSLAVLEGNYGVVPHTIESLTGGWRAAPLFSPPRHGRPVPLDRPRARYQRRWRTRRQSAQYARLWPALRMGVRMCTRRGHLGRSALVASRLGPGPLARFCERVQSGAPRAGTHEG
jgi:hypothetical protein